MTTRQQATRDNPFEGLRCMEWISGDTLDAIGWPITLIWAGILFGLGTGSGVWVGSLILIAIGASMMVQNLSKTESSVNQER